MSDEQEKAKAIQALTDAVVKIETYYKYITFSQIWSIIKSLPAYIIIITLIAIFPSLGAVTLSIFKLGQNFPNFSILTLSNSPSSTPPTVSSPIERKKPTDFPNYDVSPAYLDKNSWVIALVSKLEIEAPSETIVKLETKSFEYATTDFIVDAYSTRETPLSGYAFRVHTEQGIDNKVNTLYQPLDARVEETSLKISVPKCEKGDSLFFIFRLANNGSKNLRNLLQVRIQK